MIEAEEPAHIKDIRKKKGSDFLDGARRTVEKVAKLQPGEKVLIAGTKSHEHFLRALHYYAKKLGADSKLIITDHIREGSEEQEKMVQAVREHKPDVLLFALTNNLDDTTGRFAVYDAVNSSNPNAFTITMPGITDDAIRRYIPENPDTIRLRANTLARALNELRGKEIKVETIDHLGGRHVMTARIPDGRDEERFREHAVIGDDGKPQQIFKVHADDQARRNGQFINLPAGEAYFQPIGMEGEAFLAPGTIVMDHGVVKEGMIIKVAHDKETGHSRVVAVNPIGEEDKELAQKLLAHIDTTPPVGDKLEKLKGDVRSNLKRAFGRDPTDEEVENELQERLEKISNRNVIAEQGIGINPLIKSASGNLIGEKINATIHWGIGDNYKDYGIVKADRHGDIIFTKGKLYIGGKLFVDMDNRVIPLLDK